MTTAGRRERQPDWRGRVEACGTVHTAEGWQRRQQRDKARQRARVVVRRLNVAEFDAIVAADTDRRPSRKWARALREIAARHPVQYADAYRAALAEVGYDLESHACNHHSTSGTITSETSGPGAASTARDLPEPGKGSEMADRTRSNNLSGSR